MAATYPEGHGDLVARLGPVGPDGEDKTAVHGVARAAQECGQLSLLGEVQQLMRAGPALICRQRHHFPPREDCVGVVVGGQEDCSPHLTHLSSNISSSSSSSAPAVFVRSRPHSSVSRHSRPCCGRSRATASHCQPLDTSLKVGPALSRSRSARRDRNRLLARRIEEEGSFLSWSSAAWATSLRRAVRLMAVVWLVGEDAVIPPSLPLM